jgi:hypothetical protein
MDRGKAWIGAGFRSQGSLDASVGTEIAWMVNIGDLMDNRGKAARVMVVQRREFGGTVGIDLGAEMGLVLAVMSGIGTDKELSQIPEYSEDWSLALPYANRKYQKIASAMRKYLSNKGVGGTVDLAVGRVKVYPLTIRLAKLYKGADSVGETAEEIKNFREMLETLIGNEPGYTSIPFSFTPRFTAGFSRSIQNVTQLASWVETIG